MKNIIKDYKNSMVFVFKTKYNIPEFEASKIIREYDFDNILVECNYIALHDDPEEWVDEIYEWAFEKNELIEL